ncbi:TetR/AcrR family transcriptional regulator [Saccharopolyspora hordei]|uniref:AcrR family transcriptional regulator n=1 Tax=Saccharopolyspora hordei TaxID=1838 RepID=A0A853ALK8_9PSEU|nr:TetR/AcrR family transcriptional regulator [Saccharopolyspora hordei]NYI83929.1 AcrR family transcriptional regulator [Saccharopolyspora hordei]
MSSSPLRVYGGVQGDDRKAERRAQLLEAGLDLLGAAGDGPALTVRGACQKAGLATRYFYESFADRDALAAAVYDHVVDGLATTTLEAVNGAGPDERSKVRAGLQNIVRTIADDPRRGRLLFSVSLHSPLLARRRMDSSRLFAALLGGQAQDYYGITESPHLELTTHFIVGGLAQALTAWLDGTLRVDEDELVAHCTEVFLAIAAGFATGD